MNKDITIYDVKTGKIKGFISGYYKNIEESIKVFNYTYIDGIYSEHEYYVVGGKPVKRKENPSILTGLNLTKVPVPSKIYINNVEYESNEDKVELSFNHPGTYKIRIESWPYLDKEFTIENPA